jgi:hypothetical protein
VEELNKNLKMFPGYHNDMELQDDELLDLYKSSVECTNIVAEVVSGPELGPYPAL